MQKAYKHLIALFIVLLLPLNVLAFENVPEKTPDDVFMLTQMIISNIEQLKSISLDKEIMKDIPAQSGKSPRHVLQQAYDILGKISKFREINKFGAITTPPYPNRPITPDEVYALTARIHREVDLIFEMQGIAEHKDNYIKVKGKRPSDVYREMLRISVLLDSLMGIRGYTPNDVFALSQKLLEEVKFLRISQGNSLDITMPERTAGKHPNHALEASYDLLKKISVAQRNLWLRPVSTKEVPMRVIIPNEVYDSIQENLMEIQRIKYRLGLEHTPKGFPVEEKKSPDDVIYNIRWAESMLPLFDDLSIKQNPRSSLIKTPNEVYALTLLILDELERIKAKKHITAPPPEVVKLTNRRSGHVFIKAYECLRKVNHHRISKDNTKITLPEIPLREITPDEVFDIM